VRRREAVEERQLAVGCGDLVDVDEPEEDADDPEVDSEDELADDPESPPEEVDDDESPDDVVAAVCFARLSVR
jgi:hypothetical protein